MGAPPFFAAYIRLLIGKLHELAFANPAGGADEVVGNLGEWRSGFDALFKIAVRFIVHVAAHHADPLGHFHQNPSYRKECPSLFLSQALERLYAEARCPKLDCH